jgi:type VI protein secretion system component VasK
VWVLQFLPDSLLEFIIYSILGLGFVATIVSLIFINPLLKFFPGIAGTYRIIQLISVLVFLLGVYLWGGYSTEMRWRERVNEMQEKVKLAEAQAAAANRAVSEGVKEADVKVIEKTRTVTQYIDKIVNREILKEVPVEGPERVRIEKVIEYVEKCPVPQELIDLHNQAAERAKK